MGVAELELAHVVSASVLETVNAYWTYVAATRMLDIRRGAEARTTAALEDIRALVDAATARPRT